MPIYHQFASIYQGGWYPNFSLELAKYFPSFLDFLQFKPSSILDLACGEGTFAVEMAKLGFTVTGVDQSKKMLQLAKEKAAKCKVSVNWIRQDIIQLNLPNSFDLCTCWFDSLNYILHWSELATVFKGVQKILRPDGYFIFDMNTRFGLIENWNKFPCYIPQDKQNCFEVHQPSFDYEQNIASLKITAFLKQEKSWKRIQEVHKEKAYSMDEIKNAYHEAGLIEKYCFESIREKSSISEESGRVFFVLQNKI